MGPTNQPNAKWLASVSLRRDYCWDNDETEVPGRAFPGWIRASASDEREVPFMSTNSRLELTTIIDRAQLATICPRWNHLEFTRRTAPVVPQSVRRDFSPNIVCINIEGPGLPDSSFYDLPGIIGQSEDPQKQFLVPFVKSLVTEYIEHPNALILLTCSLSSDIATSTASGIARSLKAEDRCIG